LSTREQRRVHGVSVSDSSGARRRWALESDGRRCAPRYRLDSEALDGIDLQIRTEMAGSHLAPRIDSDEDWTGV